MHHRRRGLLHLLRRSLPWSMVLASWCVACTNDEEAAATERRTDAGSAHLGTGEGGMRFGADPNHPPSAPRLVSPADGATHVPTRTALCWSASHDSDGDAVRYRIFVDGRELTRGIVGEQGFEGPCTELLVFDAGRSFRWQVQAFDPDDATAASNRSESWVFTTAPDGEDRVVFRDDFEVDRGWRVSGDATTGAWVRGVPEETWRSSDLAQPGTCANGSGCYFTARNGLGDPSDQDVDAGYVLLESPPLDLSGAGNITVSLSRFFYRSDPEQTGARWQLELVLPDVDTPEAERVVVLDEIDVLNAGGKNAWTPVSFSVCGSAFGRGASLRVIAADSGNGVVEAAVDDVVVTSHPSPDRCERGPGAACDPTAADPCEGDLLCCQHGTFNSGAYRCASPARAIDPDDVQVEGEDNTGELGCPLPDLTVVADLDTVAIEWESISPNSCAVREACVGGTGERRLLRFGMRTRNEGARDLVLGVPANHPDQYHFDGCHAHYHLEGFADYSLLDVDGRTVARGRKVAQCVWDSESWAWPTSRAGAFACYNQGLSVGWGDEYDGSLDCQWIDITDVAPGDYTVRIDVNAVTEGYAEPRLLERDYANNSVSFPVTIPP